MIRNGYPLGLTWAYMDPLADLPAGWAVWSAEDDGRVILTFHPEVFDADTFPPACLPTLTVAPGPSPDARPEARQRGDQWHVALYLEPDVRVRRVETRFDDRDDAVKEALEIARAFADGAIDYRAAYHDPPVPYLDRLDELIERGR